MEEERLPADAELTVFHEDEGDYTSRIIHLALDGAKIASLKSGNSLTLAIRSGRHTLQADNTFTKKRVTFAAQPGERLRYVTRNRAGFGSSLIAILGAGPLYLVLQAETESDKRE